MNLNGKTINPGELRTRVTLESRTVTSAGGFQTATWAPEYEVWARWENVHGAEVWAAESAQARKPATVLMRFRAIDETWAVVLGQSSLMTEAQREAARYEIVSIDNIQQRGEYMEIKVQLMRAG